MLKVTSTEVDPENVTIRPQRSVYEAQRGSALYDEKVVLEVGDSIQEENIETIDEFNADEVENQSDKNVLL